MPSSACIQFHISNDHNRHRSDAQVVQAATKWKRVVFFNDRAPTEICPLSLHDALPISLAADQAASILRGSISRSGLRHTTLTHRQDRKSTRLNSSHLGTSYAVFCL